MTLTSRRNLSELTLIEVKQKIKSLSKDELISVLSKAEVKAQSNREKRSRKSPERIREEAEYLKTPFQIVR